MNQVYVIRDTLYRSTTNDCNHSSQKMANDLIAIIPVILFLYISRIFIFLSTTLSFSESFFSSLNVQNLLYPLLYKRGSTSTNFKFFPTFITSFFSYFIMYLYIISTKVQYFYSVLKINGKTETNVTNIPLRFVNSYSKI